MESLTAIFIILYIFWPLLVFFGIRELFHAELSLAERFRLGFNRIFIGWVVWAFFLGFIYWQKQQPILILPEAINHLFFALLGIISGGYTIAGWIRRWQERRVRLLDAQTLEDLLALSPDDFERLIAALFRSYGYRAHISGGNSDHGVDVLVENQQDEKWVVQCKRYSGSVGEPVVRDLYGTMLHESAQRAYLMTTGSFTAQAKAWVAGKPIVLYDGDSLVKLIRRTQKLAHQTSKKH